MVVTHSLSVQASTAARPGGVNPRPNPFHSSMSRHLSSGPCPLMRADAMILLALPDQRIEPRLNRFPSIGGCLRIPSEQRPPALFDFLCLVCGQDTALGAMVSLLEQELRRPAPEPNLPPHPKTSGPLGKYLQGAHSIGNLCLMLAHPIARRRLQQLVLLLSPRLVLNRPSKRKARPHRPSANNFPMPARDPIILRIRPIGLCEPHIGRAWPSFANLDTNRTAADIREALLCLPMTDRGCRPPAARFMQPF